MPKRPTFVIVKGYKKRTGEGIYQEYVFPCRTSAKDFAKEAKRKFRSWNFKFAFKDAAKRRKK